MAMMTPMPSPNGTNYEGLFTKVSMSEDLAYDAKNGRADHFALGYDTPPTTKGRVMTDAEAARHASRVANRTLRSLGYKTPTHAMARDADEPDADEDSDDYESRQIAAISAAPTYRPKRFPGSSWCLMVIER